MSTKIVESFEELRGGGDAAVAVGFFDGVHLGHKALVHSLVLAASERRLRSLILSFANHPATVVRAEAAPKLLCAREERVRLLAELGADIVCVAPFDQALSQWTPERFCREVLCERLSTRLLVVGRNFTLGRGRSGTVPVLAALGDKLGFETAPFEAVRCEDGIVSSSEIRRLVSAGAIEQAARLLGRPFSVSGSRAPGNGLGRELGYPTLNLRTNDDLLLPAPGIYAGRAAFQGRSFEAVAYLGARATFGGSALSFEVHLLDATGALEPSLVEVEFLVRLREDRRFDSAAELARQIGEDVAAARRALTALSARSRADHGGDPAKS